MSATPAATSSKASSKPKRFAAKPAVSTEPQFDDGSAEQTVPSLPSASAEPVLAAAPVIAPVPPLAREAVRSKRVLAGAALVAPGSVRSSAGSAAPSTALSSAAPEAMNARVEAAPPRLDPAAALFADANRARRDGNADRAVALYRSLQSRYPSSSESELSRALLAQLLLDRGSPEAALAGFDRYLAADAPVLSAEALVGRARALEQLGKSAQAIAAWREIQTRFAGSVHARLAATRLAALGMR
ncbi:MAG: tetratricopeptide repeat protein [Polyangiaceae bacterium]